MRDVFTHFWEFHKQYEGSPALLTFSCCLTRMILDGAQKNETKLARYCDQVDRLQEVRLGLRQFLGQSGKAAIGCEHCTVGSQEKWHAF